MPEQTVDEAIARVLNDDAGPKGGFHRVFAAPDDPTQVDEASPVAGRARTLDAPPGKARRRSAATDAVTDALTRCRASQRRFRNTLIFVAADEGLLATAREAMRRALAWADIVGDERLQKQLTQSQAADAKDKAKTSREGALRAVRNAWNHILFPVKTDATEAGKAFELDHLALTAKDKGAIPAGVYEKARADGIVMEKLGPDTLWLKLKPLWAEDRPHIAISEIADWFASYVYLPKVRDRVVLEAAIRDASGSSTRRSAMRRASMRRRAIIRAHPGKVAPEFFGPAAVLVRADVALEQVRNQASEREHGAAEIGGGSPELGGKPAETIQSNPKPRPNLGASWAR